MLMPMKGGSESSYIDMTRVETEVKRDLHRALTLNLTTYQQMLHDIVTTGKYKNKDVQVSTVMNGIAKLIELQKQMSADLALIDKQEKLAQAAIVGDGGNTIPQTSTKIPINSPSNNKDKALTDKEFDMGLPEDAVSTYYLANFHGVTPEFLYPLRMKVFSKEISHLEMNRLIKAEKELLLNGGDE